MTVDPSGPAVMTGTAELSFSELLKSWPNIFPSRTIAAEAIRRNTVTSATMFTVRFFLLIFFVFFMVQIYAFFSKKIPRNRS